MQRLTNGEVKLDLFFTSEDVIREVKCIEVKVKNVLVSDHRKAVLLRVSSQPSIENRKVCVVFIKQKMFFFSFFKNIKILI